MLILEVLKLLKILIIVKLIKYLKICLNKKSQKIPSLKFKHILKL